MNKNKKLADNFVKLIVEYREAQKRPSEYKKINKIVKKIRNVFQKIREQGDPAREELYKHLKNQPLEISSFVAAYLLRYKTKESINVLMEASKVPGDIGYGAKQTLNRWKENDWHLDEI